MKRRGLLIIISSPSGAGKSTLAKHLRAWDPAIIFSVSATTRQSRVGEQDGVDYFFMSKPEFESIVQAGDMLEHATVFGHSYGSPRKAVQQAIEQGQDVLFDIDWQGAQQILNSDLHAHVLSIFILPPSIAVLHQRLRARGQDSARIIADRMAKSMDEISHWDSYDYVLINDDLDETAERLISIVKAERLRKSQHLGMNDQIRALQAEFDLTKMT